ncbi:MAG: signal peptide peptidase SppA [Phenylobacterium sp.]|uniref:signal peptide peptidase SppA n=1 Tax=Phenylobacterium sp. TaxID=1871053 RepID=UPI002717CB7C|nr:signal peptide peptidase SppA [Phenylobacterium sp.]MDO8901252.1 signal peptide peptidase SppA [Phenylobacterium sp.]MDP2214949.1 signal peptide peptidase SppA [Phenylobacterium sp.]
MKQFLTTMAGVFAGLTLFLVGVPFLLVVIAAGATRPAPVPGAVVLQLDLRNALSDQDVQNPFSAFGGRSNSVMSVVQTLRQAEGDRRVKGLLVRLPEVGMEPGAADELRQALRRFEAAGKPVIAHSQGLYQSGVVSSTYMVGAAAGDLWMQPGAALQVTGLAVEDVFFKRFFDEYGVKPDFEQRKEFKNAVNGYLHSDYTAAHRTAQLSWMNSVYSSALNTAASDREMEPALLRARLEAGPYPAARALELGLIDRLGHLHEAEQTLLDAAGDDARLMELSAYARSAGPAGRSGPVIALIEAEGPITTGRSGLSNPLAPSAMIFSDDISAALYDAAEDDDIKAVVLRLNSPGGSDTASEQILAAVRAAKAAGKPVVVSMGTYGASGGYWVASEASAIIAQPTTLTGSIGVYGGKLALGPALAEFGVDMRELGVGGAFAGAYGMGDGFTPVQQAAFSAMMDNVYDEFIVRVARGRNLSPQRVDEIARGRVWTGAQAQSLGLVDELGGFYQAVDKAKTLAGLEGEVRLRRMTPQATPLQALERALGMGAVSVKTLTAAAWVLGDPRAQGILDTLATERLRAQGAAAVLAPTPIR